MSCLSANIERAWLKGVSEATEAIDIIDSEKILSPILLGQGINQEQIQKELTMILDELDRLASESIAKWVWY